MKKIIAIIAVLVLIMSCFGACDNDTASTSSTSSTSSKDSLSKLPLSSEDTSSEPFVPDYEVPEGYCDIKSAVINSGGSLGGDVSEYFDPDAAGYSIYDGTYMVDADTLRMLTQKPVVGDGTVVWTDFKILNQSLGNPDPFMGRVPVNKLHDPIYMSMALPSELQTYMKERVNPANMYPAKAEYRKLVAIGAVYREKDTVLPDDAEITVCISDIKLLINTEENGWHIAKEAAYPENPMMYYLPWSLEHSIGAMSIKDRITMYDDHIEIKLTGAMLNGTYGTGSKYEANKDQVEGAVLHFWGKNWVGDGASVKGCVSSFKIWIKESEYVGKVAAAIGADWRTSAGKINQAISGYNHAITTEPRLVISHNVGPNSYDKIMDTDKVQQLLGMK